MTIGYRGAFSAALLVQAACSGGASVNGSGVVVDRTTQALTSGELESVNGTYGLGCTDRTGAWSIEIASGAALDNTPLTVVLNDASCVLTLTGLRTATGLLAAGPNIVLATVYEVAGSEFGSPIEFYANAKLSADDFADDFVVTILYSDDLSRTTDDNTAEYAIVESSVTEDSVLAPDYALDVSGLALLTDAEDVIDSATGTADLTAGAVTGQRFVIVEATGLLTYAAIDAAYIAGTDAALVTSIPALAFALVGDDLTTAQVRTLIIANTEDGVTSYQAFEITFHAAM